MHKNPVRIAPSVTHRRGVSPARQGRWQASQAYRLSANPNQTTFGVMRAAIIEIVVGDWWLVVGDWHKSNSMSANHQPSSSELSAFPDQPRAGLAAHHGGDGF